MDFVEGRLKGCCVLSGVGGVERGEIVDYTDVRDDHLQLRGRNHLPDQILYFGYVLVGHFNTGSGGHFDIERELARIGLREEGPPKKWIDRQAHEEDAHEERNSQRRAF